MANTPKMEDLYKYTLPILGNLKKLVDIAEENKSSPSLTSLGKPGPIDEISRCVFKSMISYNDLQRGMYVFKSPEENDEGLSNTQTILSIANSGGKIDPKYKKIPVKTTEPKIILIGTEIPETGETETSTSENGSPVVNMALKIIAMLLDDPEYLKNFEEDENDALLKKFLFSDSDTESLDEEFDKLKTGKKNDDLSDESSTTDSDSSDSDEELDEATLPA